MRVVGTNEEIMYIVLQCQKRSSCEGCVLELFCKNQKGDLFIKLKPSHLDALETGKHTPILIAKGDDKSGNKI